MKLNVASLRSVDSFLTYRNARVISRYARDHGVSYEEAEVIFVETLKFLYLSSIIDTPCSPPSREIDEMWHDFILHSIDYVNFCGDYVGRFLHHDPTENPYVGNRDEMLKTATDFFGELDQRLWRHLMRPQIENCSSSCNDNYCDESCNSNIVAATQELAFLGYCG